MIPASQEDMLVDFSSSGSSLRKNVCSKQDSTVSNEEKKCNGVCTTLLQLPCRTAPAAAPPPASAPPPPFLRRFAAPLSRLACPAATGVLHRANSLGRWCVPEGHEGEEAGTAHQRPPSWRIAMVSFSDEAEGGRRLRSFRGVGEAVAENERAYARGMGYRDVDARRLVDPGRPPSWSKILAVQSLLPRNDWVFWNDADTMVMNPSISLESILHAAIGHENFNKSPDLVITEDTNGVNAGAFFVQRSEWS